MVDNKRSDLTPKGIKGVISNVEIFQLLQMICVGNTPLKVKAVSENGEGVFFVKDGHVLHAATNQKDGEAAFFEIALWDNVVFEIIPCQVNNVPRTIFKPWEYLALESARVKDESSKGKLIHVLIVDDSAFFAKQLKKLIEEDPEFVVVGIASNGEEAIGYMEDEVVDVVTLDAFMPTMPGDTTLKHLMIRYSVPVVVISAFLEGSSDLLFDFLRLGAVEVLPKPKNRRGDQEEYGRVLRSILKKASKAKMENFRLWKPESIKQVSRFVEVSGRRDFLVIVGMEGSYMDWFRLPLGNLLSTGYVGGFSRMDREFLPVFSELLVNYKGFGVKTFIEEKGDQKLEIGTFNIFHAYSSYSIEETEDGEYKASVLGQEIQSLMWKDPLEENILRFLKTIKDRFGILCLSGAEGFSDKWLETMFQYPVKWLLPSTDLLVFPQMVDSILKKASGRDVEVFQGNYQSLGNYWINI
ncbi:MAG: response regulator [Syntrophobacterales bacterium]|nr:response regulator [Syntrophobacterales bacterium]